MPNPMKRTTLLLGRTDIADLLTIGDCIDSVERAFRMHAEGRTLKPGVLSVDSRAGAFHIKAAGLELEPAPLRRQDQRQLPAQCGAVRASTIQGVIALCDGENGFPLALLDSIEITTLRTGAATALAARHLALPHAGSATICGCGNQGRIQLKALVSVRPIRRAFAWDIDSERARRFAVELASTLAIEIEPVDDLARAVRRSDVCVTTTPSLRYFVKREYVRPGTFVAAVGADSPDKRELEPALLAASKIVVDLLDQCVVMGELHHAVVEKYVTPEDVHAELAEIVAGTKPGRESDDEIIIFDSTGTALQDVAAAVSVYEKALARGVGLEFDFFA